ERWHPETSSFHMPFEEITVTLDDVFCLLHIPVNGRMFSLRAGFGKTSGCNLRFSWLAQHYAQAVSSKLTIYFRFYYILFGRLTMFFNLRRGDGSTLP